MRAAALQKNCALLPGKYRNTGSTAGQDVFCSLSDRRLASYCKCSATPDYTCRHPELFLLWGCLIKWRLYEGLPAGRMVRRLTRHRLRVVGRTFAVLIALCSTSYGAARVAQAITYRRATVFLEELKRIQPGQAEAFVMPFMRRYLGTHLEPRAGFDEDWYVMRFDPWHLMHLLPGPNWGDHAYRWAFSWLGNCRRFLKLRSWTVSGSVRFRNGKVETVSGDVVLEGENEWLMADWHYGSEIPEYRRTRLPNSGSPGEEPRYEAHWTHLHYGDGTGEGIRTSVTTLSTPEELNAARNINLQCLMGGSGCHSLCDLMPDATRYRREHKGGGWGGWNSGSWGMQPHDCE
jgi:hypothetical protein